MSIARFDSEAGAATIAGWPVRIVAHPRARRLKLVCDPVRGEFRLTRPPRTRASAALDWALRHADWAAAQVADAGEAKIVTAGSSVPLMGRDIRLVWRADAPRAPRLVDDDLVIGGPSDAAARRAERWLKAEARRIMEAETHDYAARAGLECLHVSIGDARSRWGSCSARQHIRYNWRLIMAPDFVRRSTVSHEVAHLAHMNHGPRFHALHAELFDGDPATARGWLRAHGQSLKLYRFE